MELFERAVLTFQEPSKLEQKDIEKLFARVFSDEEGKKVLAYLQVITFQRAYGPEVSVDQLRFAEGQRSLVATIMRMVDRGRAGQTAKNKEKDNFVF